MSAAESMPVPGVSHVGTAVIGGGQAGLVVGHELRRRDEDFVILDQHPRVGDAWRRRWSSLRLFSSPRESWLPGLRMRGGGFLSKDEFADYLEDYADHLDLPVRTGVRVRRLGRAGAVFQLDTTAGELTADRVVVCTGPYARPRQPAFATELGPDVLSMHSSAYRDPSQLRGTVLVVGAGSSGTELAWEAVHAGHPTILAGRNPGEVPFDIDRPLGRTIAPVVMWGVHRLVHLGTPWGRRQARRLAEHGHPVFRRRRVDLAQAGVRLAGRVTAVVDGRPVVDGARLDVGTVLWCTGFHRDHTWMDLPVTDDAGDIRHHRGLVDSVPGLAFVGLPFQWSAVSSTLVAVAEDARYVVDRLLPATRTRPTRRPGSPANDSEPEGVLGDEELDRRSVSVEPAEPRQVG